MHAKEGQPATGSPQISFFAIMNKTNIADKIINNMPASETIVKGAELKAAMPSKA